MTRNIHPVEELFEVRAEIRALRAREAELRAFFLENAAPDERVGPLHQVAIQTGRRRVFDPTHLPAPIREDPRYWSDRTSRVVKVIRRAGARPWDGFTAPEPMLWLAPGADGGTAADPLFEPFQ